MTGGAARESMRESMAVGIDVGGTFTDLAALHDDGTVTTSKVLSVPGDRAQGVLDALIAAEVRAEQIASIAHGTTVVTNLLLERRGARVVACATQGFTDLLELRRQGARRCTISRAIIPCRWCRANAWWEWPSVSHPKAWCWH